MVVKHVRWYCVRWNYCLSRAFTYSVNGLVINARTWIDWRVTTDNVDCLIDASIPNNQQRFSVTTDNGRAMFNELRYRS